MADIIHDAGVATSISEFMRIDRQHFQMVCHEIMSGLYGHAANKNQRKAPSPEGCKGGKVIRNDKPSSRMGGPSLENDGRRPIMKRHSSLRRRRIKEKRKNNLNGGVS